MFQQNNARKLTITKILSVMVILLMVASCAPQTTSTVAPTAASTAPGGQTEAAPQPTKAAQPTEPVAVVPTSVGPVELSMWTEFTAGGEATGIDALVSAWNAKSPDMPIKHRPIGNEEFFTVVRTGLSGGEPPDLLQFEGYQQTRDFAAAGQLLDLTSWWNENKSRFDLVEPGEYACTFEGKVYCVPYTFLTGWQIYYNPEILTVNGIEIPQTFEDFLAAAEKLKAAGITPIALGNKDGWPGEHWWMAFLVQRCGVDTVYQAIRMEGAKFTDECFVQATNDYQNLATSGYLSEGAASDDYGTSQAVFLSGQAAFFQTGSWFASGWEQTPPPFEVGIMSFPRFKDSPYSGDVIGAITHVFGIPSNAKNQEAALKALDFLISDEAAAIWAANGNSSVVKGAVDAAAPQVIKDIWTNAKSAEKSLPWIENELPPGIGEDKVYNGTVALLSGSMTSENFLKSIQDALEASK